MPGWASNPGQALRKEVAVAGAASVKKNVKFLNNWLLYLSIKKKFFHIRSTTRKIHTSESSIIIIYDHLIVFLIAVTAQQENP
jgi:hypothetical protein